MRDMALILSQFLFFFYYYYLTKRTISPTNIDDYLFLEMMFSLGQNVGSLGTDSVSVD